MPDIQLNLDHHASQTISFLRTFKEIIDTLSKLDTTIQSLCSHPDNTLFVTNHTQGDSCLHPYYCLVINKNQVLYSEKTTTHISHYCLDLNTFECRYNDQLCDQEQLSFFLDHLDRTFSDLKSHRAHAYDYERISS